MSSTKITLPLLGLAGLLSALPASAQRIPVEDRGLRQPPAQTRAAPAASELQSRPLEAADMALVEANSGNWEMVQQIQQLQEEVRSLRGQVEEQGHLLERLRNDQRSRYTDLDQRLNALSERASAPPAAGPAPAQPTAETPATVVNIEEEKKAYIAAYEVFRAQGPDKAIPPMLAFVGRYPNSTFAPNAHYWLGEFYLAATRPNAEQAQRQFETVLSKFPDNAKAPAALYKLGTIADLQNKPEEARKLMQAVLSRYPSSPEAALANNFLKAASKR